MTDNEKCEIARKKLDVIEKMIKSQRTLSDKVTLSDSDNIPFDLIQSYA